MRGFLVIFAVAGCGRLGFDDVVAKTTDGPAGDAANLVPDICNPRATGDGQLPAAEVATKVRATQLTSGGFAVAIETDLANTYVERLDASGAFVSRHLPFAGGYLLQGISQIEDRPFVYVFTSGSGFIKMLIPSWDDYQTGPSGEQQSMDPQQALLPGGTLAMYGVIASGQLGITAIDVTGASTVGADYSPAASTASFASTPSGTRVVVEDAGTCETFAIAPDGTTGPRHSFSPCVAPLLAMIDDQTGAVLHRTSTAGPLVLHTIPANASDAGTTTTLEIGTNGRVTVFGGAIWVAYRQPAGDGRIVRVGADGTTTTRDYPMIDAAFDLLPSAAFWIDSDGLHVGEPCL